MADRKPSSSTRHHADVPLPDADAVLDAALAQLGENGLSALSMQAVADRLGVPVARLLAVFPHRPALLSALLSRVDRKTLAGITDEDERQPPRDRLFDLLMRRLEVLGPDKEAVRALAHDGWREPALAAWLGFRLHHSMALMLEAAGLPTRGLSGRLRVRGLGAVWAWTVRAWLADDTPDLTRTMKTLDAALARAGDLDRLICRDWRGRDKAGAGPTPV